MSLTDTKLETISANFLHKLQEERDQELKKD